MLTNEYRGEWDGSPKERKLSLPRNGNEPGWGYRKNLARHDSEAGNLPDTRTAIRPTLTGHIEAVTSISVPGEVAGLGARQNKTRIVM